MELTLVEKRREPGEDPYGWSAFERDDRFNEGWWHLQDLAEGKFTYVEGYLDGIAVARAKLDEEIDTGEYEGAPVLGTRALEIQFVEVASTHRGQGIGAEFIARLARAHRPRILVALSYEADRFWTSLGWIRFDHPDGPLYAQPLFIQPAEAPC